MHDFKVATNLPLLNVGNTSIVSDGLWPKEWKQRRHDEIQVVWIDGLFYHQMTLFGQLFAENKFGNILNVSE